MPPAQAIADGDCARVPILMGTNPRHRELGFGSCAVPPDCSKRGQWFLVGL
jgi:hypothetical protein